MVGETVGRSDDEPVPPIAILIAAMAMELLNELEFSKKRRARFMAATIRRLEQFEAVSAVTPIHLSTGALRRSASAREALGLARAIGPIIRG